MSHGNFSQMTTTQPNDRVVSTYHSSLSKGKIYVMLRYEQYPYKTKPRVTDKAMILKVDGGLS
jgi:hypothetical protein